MFTYMKRKKGDNQYYKKIVQFTYKYILFDLEWDICQYMRITMRQNVTS